MTDQEVAADHLKIIRSLMQRATVYRAISLPAALFGGIIALITGIAMALTVDELEKTPGAESIAHSSSISPQNFFLIWVGVLIVVGAFNTLLLWRGSQLRGESFFSSGMKLALRATGPAMLAGGLVSFLLLDDLADPRTTCTLLWVVFYSLALLGARSFAPRSMRWLGWMFFSAGLGLFFVRHYLASHLAGKFSTDQAQAGLIMALTFGALHLIYALIILCRPKGEEDV